MTQFVRFSDRLAGRQPNDGELHEGVPAHLEAVLAHWLIDDIERNPDLHHRVGIILKVSGYSPTLDEDELVQAIEDAGDLLDAVDLVLHLDEGRHDLDELLQKRPGAEHVYKLRQMLTDSGSAYQVEHHGLVFRLVRRVDETVQTAYDAAQLSSEASGRGNAAQRLREAWHAAYGRNPESGVAYSSAVKAVEAAAIPVISPNNDKATLGTVTAALRDQAAKWSFAIGHRQGTNPVDLVVAMMNGLWTGQTDRHEGGTPAKPITQESAEAAVQLAVTLVHWFSTGKVTKTG
jgi:hypothetical protein